MEDYYFCNECENEISVDDIEYDKEADQDICPECGSCDVDYFSC